MCGLLHNAHHSVHVANDRSFSFLLRLSRIFLCIYALLYLFSICPSLRWFQLLTILSHGVIMEVQICYSVGLSFPLDTRWIAYFCFFLYNFEGVTVPCNNNTNPVPTMKYTLVSFLYILLNFLLPLWQQFLLRWSSLNFKLAFLWLLVM